MADRKIDFEAIADAILALKTETAKSTTLDEFRAITRPVLAKFYMQHFAVPVCYDYDVEDLRSLLDLFAACVTLLFPPHMPYIAVADYDNTSKIWFRKRMPSDNLPSQGN